MKKPNYEKCDSCHRKLYYADGLYEQDECYEFEEQIYCEECFFKLVRSEFYKKLEE